MMPGSNILYECPVCRKEFYSETIGSANTYGAKFWSDGFVDAPMYPDLPPFVRCPNCKTGLWLSKLKELEVLHFAINLDVPKFLMPDVKSILHELRNEHSYNQEIWLLKRLLQITNHRRRKVKRPLSNNGRFALEAFVQLVPYYYSDESYLFLIECHRELGNFSKAMEMCNYSELLKTDFSFEIKKQREWIEDKNSYPMIYKENERCVIINI